jgi:hypothetical protein
VPPVETPRDHSRPALVVGVVLALWLVTVFILGAKGVFPTPPGTVPIPIIIGITAPIIVFLAAFRLSRSFHNFVLAGDLSFMVGIQAWRFAGIGFLALYAQGALPGFFAWPAGLGDIAVGITAPWVALALVRRPGFKNSRLFLLWNLFGLLDLIVAVATGALSSGLAPGLTGTVTTAPMAHLPLVLIPVYFVPIFVMLHLATLFQVSTKPGKK